jgi:hypothetical protein
MELGAVWWHLSTGKWIFQNHSIPWTDPFTFTADPSVDKTFVLSAFWLCQALFHLIHLAGGLHGLIFFKAAIFSTTTFILWKGARAQGASLAASYLSVLPSIFIFTFYDEIRPQTLSLLFFALTIYILENSRLRREYQDASEAPGSFKASSAGPGPLWLIAIMPVWSNVHPGFVIGIGFLLLYMAEQLVSSILVHKGKGIDLAFLSSLTAAIVISALNPNGMEAVQKTFQMFMGSALGNVRIHEHLGIREFAEFTGKPGHLTAISIIAGAGLLSFAARFRKADILHAFIFCSMAGFAFITFRAGLFFAAAAVPVLGKNLSGLSITIQPRLKRAALITATFLVISSALFLGATRSVITQPLLSRGVFPEKAVTYIEGAGLPANLYHPYEWGGYMIWSLFPRYKAFIDSRGLIPIRQHLQVKNAGPQWMDTLERHGVNTVVFWAILPYEKRVPPIVFAIIKDPGWKAVYWDSKSLIFVRAGMAEKSLKDGTVWELLESLALRNISLEPDGTANHIALGEIYMNQGLPGKARVALEKALALEPDNLMARKLLGHLSSTGY